MYLNGETSLHGLAREHEISRNLIRLWVDKFEKGELSEELEQSAKIPEYEAKIAALERKIGQLTMEVDLLKKLRQEPSRKSEPLSFVSGPLGSPSQKDVEL
jgi:transposase-like protein